MRGRMTACFQRKDFHLMPLSRARFTRIVAGTAVVVAATPTIAPAQAPLVIKAAITPVYYDAIPVLYAQHTGMFAKAGLDLDLGRLPTGAAITAAVAGGSLDVAKATFFPQVVAFSRGIPLTVIAPAVVYDSRSPNGALVTAKNSPIKSAADMAGKIIGVNSLADPTRPAMAQWLEQGGVSKDAVKYVEIPMSLEPAAVDAHRIDAMMLTAPIIDETLATGKFRTTRVGRKEKRGGEALRRGDRERGILYEPAPCGPDGGDRRPRRGHARIDRADDVSDRRHDALRRRDAADDRHRGPVRPHREAL
jgi:ABC-type nitrate/sulfonate/bicarbonate transport system substrate-binding protein